MVHRSDMKVYRGDGSRCDDSEGSVEHGGTGDHVASSMET